MAVHAKGFRATGSDDCDPEKMGVPTDGVRTTWGVRAMGVRRLSDGGPSDGGPSDEGPTKHKGGLSAKEV